MKVYLDGILVNYLTDDLKKPSFTFQKQSETGDKVFSFTGELHFTGADYDYLYDKFVTSGTSLTNKVVLKFVDDCCSQNKVYEFYITRESLIWCEDSCDLTASALEKSLANDQYTCLKNTMIWDDFAGFKSKKHPRFSYCNELRPNWLHDAMLILILATGTSILALGPLLAGLALLVVSINAFITTINAIIDAVNTLPGININKLKKIDFDGNPATNAFTELKNFLTQLFATAVGCGRKHPSPLVRDYINNVCAKCGITFKSSILNNPSNDYWNLCYVNAPINKGTIESDTTTFWIEENRPILSGLQFLDQLKPVFNAEFEIVAGELIFERKDFFTPKTPWLDLTTLPAEKIKSICWKWSSKERYSYCSLYYQKDAVNWVGSEAVSRWGDIVEWNVPYSSQQKGELAPIFNFAACRFRDDGIDRDVLTFYENFPTINTLIKRYKNSMIMNSHTSYLPMLLIWDGQSVDNAYCNKFTNIYYPPLAGIVGANQYYNFPMWFKEGYPGNLYDRFHAINDPRTSSYLGFDFTAEIKYDCDMLNNIDIDGVIKTSKGYSNNENGTTKIHIDYKTQILTINGTV